ncbi:MAG TPA: YraN family protein [Saprospiraceae bacterium]|nr:YraN family protein [Saprospiraceae bacterium]
MAIQQDIGSLGEQYAVKLLETKGYRILEQNWRWRRAEIDIIAWDGEILVFVEVKTRSYIQHGRPEAAITKAKMQLLSQAAGAYMRKVNHEWEVRFDSIAVQVFRDGTYAIEHYEDIYFPGRNA